MIKMTGLVDGNSKAMPADKDPLGLGTENDSDHSEEWSYAALIWYLMYLANNTRPDLQYAVHACARYKNCPKDFHSKAIKQIMRNLLGTADKGIVFRPKTCTNVACCRGSA